MHEPFVIGLLSCGLQLDLEAEQPLLCTVVEVALQAKTFLLRGRDDARPGGTQLLDEMRVLEQHEGRRRQSPRGTSVLVERRVVDQHRDRSAVARDRGHADIVSICRELDCLSSHAEVAAVHGIAHGEGEQGIAHRIAEELLQVRGRDLVSHRAREELTEARRGEHATAHLADQNGERNRQSAHCSQAPEGLGATQTELGEDAVRRVGERQQNDAAEQRRDQPPSQARRRARPPDQQDGKAEQSRDAHQIEDQSERGRDRVRRAHESEGVVRTCVTAVGQRACNGKLRDQRQRHQPKDGGGQREAHDELAFEA